MSASSISTMITVPFVRPKVLGVRFGTPIPTQVIIFCHPTEGFRLEFVDGSSAEEVAKLFPEVVLEARLELMRTLKKRAGITTSFHKRATQILPPVQAIEPLPRFLREGKAVDDARVPAPPLVIPAVPARLGVPSLPIARSIVPLPIAQPAVSLPIARPVEKRPIAPPIAPLIDYTTQRDLGTDFMSTTGHFSVFDHLVDPPETKATPSDSPGSTVFASYEKTPKRLAALRAARQRREHISDLTPTSGV
jgi:hypothetical protein